MKEQLYYPIIKIPWELEKILNGNINDSELRIVKPDPPLKQKTKSWILLIILPLFALLITTIYEISENVSIVIFINVLIFSFIYFIRRINKYNKIYNEKYEKYTEIKKEFDNDINRFELKRINYSNLTNEEIIRIKKYLVYKNLKSSKKPEHFTLNERRGFKEFHFEQILNEHYPGKIITNRCLNEDADYYRQYTPDIIYRDEKINLNIDIEIDEPYIYENGEPIHYQEHGIHIDQKRDDYFTISGWIVIRFAEKQIVLWPDECINTIDFVIKMVTSIGDGKYDVSNLKKFEKFTKIKRIEAWSKTEARDFARKDYRNNYSSYDDEENKKYCLEIARKLLE